MPPKRKRILAIDPGTREMGIALLEGHELVYYGVKTIKRDNSPHERLKYGRKIVLRLIQDFRPDVLVIEKTFFASNRNSALLNVFADEIGALAKRRKLAVVGYAPSTVKRRLCGHGHASKADVARAVASHFPELKAYLAANRKWKERFHGNMFDAVALGLMVSSPRTDRI